MQAAAVITAYTLFGAIAQMRYSEAVTTVDADVLVIVPDPDRPDPLSSVYAYCVERGYQREGEAIRVGVWPVQLVPVFNQLTTEAVETAEQEELEGVMVRVIRPTYLAVIALSVGRGKDHLRILALLESGVVTRSAIASLAERHGLLEAWRRFEGRFLDE
jgi:hypothetical protein